jgi:Zn-dependent peptidase ImmA (M78 family)
MELPLASQILNPLFPVPGIFRHRLNSKNMLSLILDAAKYKMRAHAILITKVQHMSSIKVFDANRARAEAEKVLSANYINSPPITVHELAEMYGLTVFTAAFEDKNISGYIDLDNKRIVVNEENAEVHQNFSIAHELGHWIMHKDAVEKDEEEKIRIVYRKPMGEETDPIELEANAFAAYLLVPEEMFKRFQDKSDHELAQIFNVSQSLIGYRRKNFCG